MEFFTELQQNFFYKLYEKTQIPKAILRKKNRVREIRFPDLSLYFKVQYSKWYGTIIKKKKNRSIEQDREPRGKPKYLWSPSQ